MAIINVRAVRIGENRMKMRQQFWPEVPDEALWHRKVKKGFITMPRTMPLLFSMMDDMSKNKPLSGTYLALWCRTFDDCMVTINNPVQLAFEAGFGGERGVRTWMDRMKKLADLRFIQAKSGAAGPYSHVLLLNPYLVVKSLKAKGIEKISDQKLNALLSRANEIGADDLEGMVM